MNRTDLDKLIKQLPENPGILGKEEYFNSAVLIPLVLINDEYHLLFEKRAAHIRQGGEICFPGGEFDPDYDLNYEHTAVRETFEEIGIPADKIKILGKLDTLIGPRGLTVDSVLAEVTADGIKQCVIDKNEVEKIFTVPVSFFMNHQPETFSVVSEFNYTFYNSQGVEENLIPSKNKSMNEHIDNSYRKNERKVLVYKTNDEVIWGITARLVNELVQKLGA